MGPVQCKFCCFFCLTVFGYSYLSIFQSLLTLLISFKHFIYCAIQQVFILFMGLSMYFAQLFHLEGILMLLFIFCLPLLLKYHQYVLDYI